MVHTTALGATHKILPTGSETPGCLHHVLPILRLSTVHSILPIKHGGVISLKLLLLLQLLLLLLMLLRNLFERVLLLRQYGPHVSEFLLESLQHLLTNLKLHSSWVVLYGQCILAQVLNQQLILSFVVGLSHLQNHILVSLLFRWLIGVWGSILAVNHILFLLGRFLTVKKLVSLRSCLLLRLVHHFRVD
jgi:hypothetical protein